MRTTTGTQTGPDQRAATVPGVPSQGLAEAQGKVVPQPHSKPRRALGTRPPHHTGHALKPAPALPSAPASGDRQVAWSQALEQKAVKPRCGAARPRLLCLCPRPGPVRAARARADPASPSRHQILTWPSHPSGGLLPATDLSWVTPAGRGARVPRIPGLWLLEAHRGPAGSLESGPWPPLSPTSPKAPLRTQHLLRAGPGNQAIPTSLRPRSPLVSQGRACRATSGLARPAHLFRAGPGS